MDCEGLLWWTWRRNLRGKKTVTDGGGSLTDEFLTKKVTALTATGRLIPLTTQT